MGKAKKVSFKSKRNQPLAVQIEEDGVAQPTGRVKTKRQRHDDDDKVNRWQIL